VGACRQENRTLLERWRAQDGVTHHYTGICMIGFAEFRRRFHAERISPDAEDQGDRRTALRVVQRLSGIAVCGEGELIKISLLPGQAAKGKRVS
jgi:hypothetical protein